MPEDKDKKKPWEKGIVDYTRDFVENIMGKDEDEEKPKQEAGQAAPAQQGGGLIDRMRDQVEEAREKIEDRVDQARGQGGGSAQSVPKQGPQAGPAPQPRSAPETPARPRPEPPRAQQQPQQPAPAPPAAPQQPAPQAAAQRTYRVQAGDSLSKIAGRFYGDIHQWRRIYEANRDKISNPDVIHAGQELLIPEAAGGTSSGQRSYTVQSGDSLRAIAQRFYGDEMQWKRIYEANRDKISNPDLIHPGQEFIIP